MTDRDWRHAAGAAVTTLEYGLDVCQATMGNWLEGIQCGQILKWPLAFAVRRLLLPAFYTEYTMGERKVLQSLDYGGSNVCPTSNRIPRLEQPATQLGGQEVWSGML